MAHLATKTGGGGGGGVGNRDGRVLRWQTDDQKWHSDMSKDKTDLVFGKRSKSSKQGQVS